jgi:16S rRNA G527 N7-methylase RsmG
VYNFTIDKVEELENELSKANNNYDAIASKDIKDMWKDELRVLSDSIVYSASVKQPAKKKLNMKTK